MARWLVWRYNVVLTRNRKNLMRAGVIKQVTVQLRTNFQAAIIRINHNSVNV